MGQDAALASPDVIRTLAHELRQPLSTIESIAYYLTLVLPEDEKTREQLERIQQLVEQSNWMLNSAQLLTDPVAAKREPIDLREVAPELGLPSCDLPRVHGDAALVTAIEGLAALYRQCSSRSGFRVERDGDRVSIEMEARGAMVPGAALCLEGARRVIEAHGGSFDLATDAGGGIKLRVMLT